MSAKSETVRTAVASASVTMRPEVLRAIVGGGVSKGDALGAARLAGIMAAKRTAEWIPLCHPLPIAWSRIEFEQASEDALLIVATVRTTARTGVEMEALVAASAAALTIYDMAKAADKAMVIGPIRLERKEGGKSGPYARSPASRPARPKRRPAGRGVRAGPKGRRES